VKPIRAFLNRAMRFDGSPEPTLTFDDKDTGKKLRFFTKEEQQKLQRCASNAGYPVGLVVYISLYTGLRVGEVSGLMWKDIDTEKDELTVSRNIQRLRSPDHNRKTRLIVTDLEGTASNRVIHLPKQLLRILSDCREKSDSEYVLSANGKPLEPRYIQNHFRHVLDDAGLEHVNFNVLRDTFAVRAIEAGFNLVSLSKILGHGTTIMTSDRYESFYKQDVSELIDNMGEFIFAPEA
jgi:integrase